MDKHEVVLGLDVGVASVGWALIEVDAKARPLALRASGVVLFEAGTDPGKGGMNAISAGADTPLNKARRDARSMRRQIWRRAKRKRKLLRALIAHGLLPTPKNGPSLRTPKEIDEYLKSLDAVHVAKWGTSHVARQLWPYMLRRETASGSSLLAHEVGRALYHLAQRRGFLSNRRTDSKSKKDEDTSDFKSSISELQAEIDAIADGPKTLGALLAGKDPNQTRARGRYTARAMYLHEFACMWSAQAARLPTVLTEAARKDIEDAIFFQRPLKDRSHLIGKCSLLPDQRRAPLALRAYQRFRVLQTVNAIEVSLPDEQVRRLTEDERRALTDALCRDGDMTFAAVRKVLGLKKATLNFEAAKTKGLIGHRTDAKLREAFGDRFDALTEADRDLLVQTIRSFRSADALAAHLQGRWDLPPDKADDLADPKNALEEDRGSISLAAVRRLLPHLERGLTYGEARKAEFGREEQQSDEAFGELPPLECFSERHECAKCHAKRCGSTARAGASLSTLRNPSVFRALTEVRRLVNAIVRRHGKPAKIRIELARDLKNPRGVREKMTRQNRDREAVREAALKRVIKEGRTARPSREDVDKALLFEECGGICPYTGKQINFEDMFGKHPQVDIEHIWPRSRCLDDSLLNKTLCYADENRARKRGRTPFEAYGGGSARDAERYGQMLDRVLRFKGDAYARKEKHRRFAAEEIDEGFENRHLSDTRFIARACADYLALLYGGNTQTRVGEDGNKSVETPTGGLTAWLRTGWGLSRLLGETAEKNRSDHRHHAIDAIVVALSDQGAVQRLADAAKRAEKKHEMRAFEEVEEPFAGFRERAKQLIDGMIVAHRQSRKIKSGEGVRGPLHTASIYSKPLGDAKDPEYRVRKELHKLSPNEIEKGLIVDKRALAAIRCKLAELGIKAPDAKTINQVFGKPENAPLVRGHGGEMVRLRKVRVVEGKTPKPLGRKVPKNVLTEGNHHTTIVEVKDARGRVQWTDEPVTLAEAFERLNRKQDVVQRHQPEGRRFVFSLAANEYVEIDHPIRGKTGRIVCRVSNLSRGQNELRLHRDGRPAGELRGSRAEGRADERVIVDGEKLRRLKARKVRVTYLGEVLPTND